MAEDPEKDIKAEVGEQRSELGSYVRLSQVGYDFSASVLACGFIGWLADRYLDTQPWGLLVMIVVGFVVGLTNMWRILSGYGKAAGSNESDKKGK